MKKIVRKNATGITRRITINMVKEDLCDYPTDTPERLYQFWQDIVARQSDHEDDKENLVVIILSTRLYPFAWHRVSIGTVSETCAHPREIMRPVLLAGGSSFCLMHNHPSGDLTPSRCDQMVTRRIHQTASLMQIRLRDHVIIGTQVPECQPYFSFREARLRPF